MRSTTSSRTQSASVLGLSLALAASAVACALPQPAVASPTPFASVLTAPDVPGAVWDPGSVVIGPQGQIAIVDTGNDRVRLLAADGSLICDIGASGTGPERLVEPQNAAFAPNGDVYIADTGNDRIQVFKPDGDHLWSIGATSALEAPVGVTVDSAGRIYVTERDAHRVAKFSASGTLLARWGSYGAGSLQFRNPRGIVVDSTGKLFVADTSNQRVEALDANTGAYLGEWGYYKRTDGSVVSRYVAPVGMSLTSAGDIIVTDMGLHKIERCAPTPRPPERSPDPLQTWGGPPAGTGISQLQSPRGATLTSSGALYVADSGNSRISRWASGTWLQPWCGYGTAAGMLFDPQAITGDAFGGFVVADTANNRLCFFDSAGAFRSTVGTGGAGVGKFSAPGGLAFGPGGYLYVSDTGHNYIQKLNADGSFVTSFGAGVLSAPRGIAVDGSGVLLVADSGSGRIARFGAAGGFLGWFGASGTGNGQFLSPSDVSVDLSGALWVADTGNHRVQKLDVATGAFRLATPGFGTAGGYMISPQGVAALPDGSVLVADTGNTRFQHLGPAGDFIQIAGGRSVTPWVPHAPIDATAMADGRTWALERDGALARMLLQDPDPPTTAIVGVPSGASNLPVRLSLVASDTFSGVRGSYYRVNAGPPLDYAGPFTVSAEGTTDIGYYSVDKAGNREIEHTATVVIDTTPPDGTSLVAGGAPWVTTRTVSIEASVSGAVEMRVGVGVDLSEWAPYSETTSTTLPDSDGLHAVAAEYRDAVHNTLRLTQTVGLDRLGPSAPVASSPTHPLGKIVRKRTTAQFIWSPPADTSGVTGYSWSIDRAATTTPDAIPESSDAVYWASGLTGGTWYFHINAVDLAGNWGQVRHVPIRLTSVPSMDAPGATLISADASGSLFAVAGAIRPLHIPGGTLHISGAHYEGGRWVTRARGKASVVPAAAGASRYRGFITLGSGFWRLRVYHAYDGMFEPAWGPYSPTIDLR